MCRGSVILHKCLTLSGSVTSRMKIQKSSKSGRDGYKRRQSMQSGYISHRRQIIGQVCLCIHQVTDTHLSSPILQNTTHCANKVIHKTLCAAHSTSNRTSYSTLPILGFVDCARMKNRPLARVSVRAYPKPGCKRLDDRVYKRRFVMKRNANKRNSKRRREHERKGTAKELPAG